MKWSEGHNWRVELPPGKQINDSTNYTQSCTYEFKFVVKFSENGQNYFKVIRWEGGSKNHVFDSMHIKSMLQDPITIKYVNQKMQECKKGSKSIIKIGSYMGNCGLFLNDSTEAQNMPKTADHVELEYDFVQKALIFTLIWQD